MLIKICCVGMIYTSLQPAWTAIFIRRGTDSLAVFGSLWFFRWSKAMNKLGRALGGIFFEFVDGTLKFIRSQGIVGFGNEFFLYFS